MKYVALVAKIFEKVEPNTREGRLRLLENFPEEQYDDRFWDELTESAWNQIADFDARLKDYLISEGFTEPEYCDSAI